MTRHNFGLDLVRAIAISMVYLFHFVTVLQPFRFGVDLFFVLSGFLIGRIYWTETAKGTFAFADFWRKRWARTLPPYFVALVLVACFGKLLAEEPVQWYYAFFFQNYIGVEGFAPSWSLCVEEHFYLALPLIGWVALRTVGRRRLVWLLPMLALLPVTFRAMARRSGAGLSGHWFWQTHLHFEGLVLGVFLAFVFVDRREIWEKIKPLAMALSVLPLLLIAVQLKNPQFAGSLFILWALGFAGWVRMAYEIRWEPAGIGASLVKRAVGGLALCSYSVYLTHLSLFAGLHRALAGRVGAQAESALVFVGALTCGVIFYFLVERPTVLLRNWVLQARPVLVFAGKRTSVPAISGLQAS